MTEYCLVIRCLGETVDVKFEADNDENAIQILQALKMNLQTIQDNKSTYRSNLDYQFYKNIIQPTKVQVAL